MTNKFDEMKLKQQLRLERPSRELAIAGIIMVVLSILMVFYK